jgi:competence ComEA-like helix-hairpin-helix protein
LPVLIKEYLEFSNKRSKIGGFMRRKLFFFLEKLQVTRRERITIGILVITLTILGLLNNFIESKAVYDAEYYEKLEQIFDERSRQAEHERNEVLARYHPEVPETIDPSSLPAYESAGDTIPDLIQEETGSASSLLININTADSEELQSLPGIGPAYAERIIGWREENGVFQTAEQLLEIRGIGRQRLEAIRPLIKLTDENRE